MWAASAIAGLFALVLAIWIADSWAVARRTPKAGAEDAPANDPPGSVSAPYLRAFALLFALLAAGLDAACASSDAAERQYAFAWAFALPGTGMLGGLALALNLLADPRPVRRAGAEIFAWSFLLAAFGVAACFGVAFVS